MLLDTKSPGIAADRGVGADDAVAGDDYRDGVSSQGITDRTRRPRFADLTRDTGVGVDATERDRGGSLENRALKGRHHAPIKGNVEASALATKVFVQLGRGTVENPSNGGICVCHALQPDGLRSTLAQALDERLVGQIGREIDLPQSFRRRSQNQLADRTVHPRVPDTVAPR